MYELLLRTETLFLGLSIGATMAGPAFIRAETLIILVLGRVFAEPLDQITPLDPPRRALAVFGLIVFILVFIPVPLVQVQTLAAVFFH